MVCLTVKGRLSPTVERREREKERETDRQTEIGTVDSEYHLKGKKKSSVNYVLDTVQDLV